MKGFDYNDYKYCVAEYIRYGTTGYLIAFALLFLFYHSIQFSLIAGIPAAYFYLHVQKKSLMEKRKLELRVQFKDLMEALVSSLGAGYSMENALIGAGKDLSFLYPKESYILRELRGMTNAMQLGARAGELFEDLGKRSGIEDICLFAQIYRTAKQTGGNLIVVMRQTASNISEKIEMNHELETMIAGKKLEAKCMVLIPLLMLVYLQVCSPGFLDPLYKGLLGRGIMSIALALYIVGYLWTQKIINIKI